jgi:hypothetical protein
MILRSLTHGDRSCNAGYLKSGASCTGCPVGTYSTAAGAAACLACTNKPSTNTYYIAKADETPFTSNTCYW